MKITKIYQGDFWASGFRKNEILNMSKWGIFPDNPEPINPTKYLTEIPIDRVDYTQDLFFETETGYIMWYSGVGMFFVLDRNRTLEEKNLISNIFNGTINTVYDFINLLNSLQYYNTVIDNYVLKEENGFSVPIILYNQGEQLEDTLSYYPAYKYMCGSIDVKNNDTDFYINYIFERDKKYC